MTAVRRAHPEQVSLFGRLHPGSWFLLLLKTYLKKKHKLSYVLHIIRQKEEIQMELREVS